MLITVVAVLCGISTGFCVEAIVTDSDATPGLTMMRCQIGAQSNIASWMANHPKYGHDWRLADYKCLFGHYDIKGMI